MISTIIQLLVRNPFLNQNSWSNCGKLSIKIWKYAFSCRISLVTSFSVVSTFLYAWWGFSTYLLARSPLARAWNCTIMSVSLRSLSSSRWASTPARKKILLCPMRNRLESSSNTDICRHIKKDIDIYIALCRKKILKIRLSLRAPCIHKCVEQDTQHLSSTWNFSRIQVNFQGSLQSTQQTHLGISTL